MEKFTPLAKNFTLPPAVAAVTNSTSVQLIFLISPSIPPQKSESLIDSTKSTNQEKVGALPNLTPQRLKSTSLWNCPPFQVHGRTFGAHGGKVAALQKW